LKELRLNWGAILGFFYRDAPNCLGGSRCTDSMINRTHYDPSREAGEAGGIRRRRYGFQRIA